MAAAASLEYAFEEELIPLFEEAHPGVTVRGTYDSSGKLQTQIEEGMEADVFMSAARQQMDSLAEEGFVDGDSVADLLDNQIVLITPADNEAGLASFTDLTKADTIAVGILPAFRRVSMPVRRSRIWGSGIRCWQRRALVQM